MPQISIFLRTFSLLRNFGITLLKIELILAYYLRKIDLITAHSLINQNQPVEERPLSLKTLRKYYRILSRLIMVYHAESMERKVLRGEVEIDESLVYKIRRGDHGRLAKIRVWLLGLRQRGSKTCLVYTLPSRTRSVILPLIWRHVAVHSTIYTDCFSAYVDNSTFPRSSHLSIYGYHHLMINHSTQFVSQFSSTIHTNTVERFWRNLKSYTRQTKPKIYFDEDLCRYNFLECVSPAIQKDILRSYFREFVQVIQ